MSVDRHIEHIAWPDSKPTDIDVGLLQMQVLWLLSRKSDHGYELMKSLSLLKGTKITQGTLYPTLKRLEELELIRRTEHERRIVYHITAKGRKTMNQSCLEFVKTFYGIFHDFGCKSCSFYEKEGKK